MRTHTLLLALRDFTRTVLSGEKPVPRVHIHALPSENPAAFPFVLVRLMRGRTDDDSCEDSVGLVLGMHVPGDPELAGLTCAAMGDTLRAALWHQRLLAERFELQFPLELIQPEPEKKQHDYHLFTLVTHWNSILPTRRLEGDVYGDEQLITRGNHG